MRLALATVAFAGLVVGWPALAEPTRVPPDIVLRWASEVLRQAPACKNSSPPACAAEHEAFSAQYGKARINQIPEQREVAWTLLWGNTAVPQNRIEACAWIGMVISQVRNAANNQDATTYMLACQSLSPPDLDRAQARLNQLRTLIAADLRAIMAANRR